MLAYNNVGTLVKLDVRSLSRHEISFTRVCVRVDIIEPLLKYAKITRARGVTCGYVLWYEDFLLAAPFVDVIIIVLKNVFCSTLLRGKLM